MQISKRRFTDVALGHVEPMRDYDKDEIIARTAIDLADNFYDEFSANISAEEITKLRQIFRVIAGTAIDWTRLNRKAHPDEYADTIKGGAWQTPIIVGDEL